MAAPEYLKLDQPYSGFLFWGGLILFFVTIVVVVALSLHDDRAKKKVVGPILTMALGTLILGGGIAWYFWSSRVNQIPTSEVSARLKKPSALLTYESDRLILYNKGNEGFYIAGDKVGDEARDIAPPPRLVPKDAYYYLFTDRLKTWALAKFGPNTSQLVPFEVYLEDEDKNNKFTGKFALLIVIKDGEVSINAQNFGVTDDLW